MFSNGLNNCHLYGVSKIGCLAVGGIYSILGYLAWLHAIVSVLSDSGFPQQLLLPGMHYATYDWQ